MLTADSEFLAQAAHWWTIMWRPVLQVGLGGALAGLVGTFGVLHRRVFFTEAITHGTFPGAVLGVVIGTLLGAHLEFFRSPHALSLSLSLGATVFCLCLAALMRALASLPGQSPQAAAGIVLASGFAAGYLLLTWFQPLPVRVESFLTGSVLTVNTTDLLLVGTLLAAAIALCTGYRRQLVFSAFDRHGAQAAGIAVARLDIAMYFLLALTAVVLIPAMGTIVPLALMTAPAVGLRCLFDSATQIIRWSAPTGAAIGLSGLAIASLADLSPSGTIGLCAVGCAAACAGGGAIRRRLRHPYGPGPGRKAANPAL